DLSEDIQIVDCRLLPHAPVIWVDKAEDFIAVVNGYRPPCVFFEERRHERSDYTIEESAFDKLAYDKSLHDLCVKMAGEYNRLFRSDMFDYPYFAAVYVPVGTAMVGHKQEDDLLPHFKAPPQFVDVKEHGKRTHRQVMNAHDATCAIIHECLNIRDDQDDGW
nr:hypothetical protein [Clostridia bacterium]